jgi:hypothetical protein
MNDDWRLQIDPQEDAHAGQLIGHLDAGALKHELSEAFHDRVIVSRERHEPRVFLYAGTREQAEAARKLIDSLARQHGWTLSTELRHWHPTAEAWEEPDKPLPDSDLALRAEHQEEIAAEDKKVREQGYPEFEVRVEFPSHRDAVSFRQKLRDEGFSSVHRWKYLLVGAIDEDEAKQLAERLREEAPEGSEIKVEGTWKAALAESPPNPFAVLGGLGG